MVDSSDEYRETVQKGVLRGASQVEECNNKYFLSKAPKAYREIKKQKKNSRKKIFSKAKRQM